MPRPGAGIRSRARRTFFRHADDSSKCRISPRGGVIAIEVEKNRMVFDVNLSLVKSQNLEISAEVLSLAGSVR